MPSPEIMPGRCGAKVDNGYCIQWPIRGTKRCRSHPGMPLATARAKGNVVIEIARWGLGTATADPGEVLLRLVTQSAARVELYSQLLGQAYAAAERVRQAHAAEELLLPGDSDDDPELSPAVQAARVDLRRIFSTGGVAALIGYKFDSDKGQLYAVEEGIRGLAKLEGDERDRCASFATKAIAAGLAERQVRLAEQQGALMWRLLTLVLTDFGIDQGDPRLQPILAARVAEVLGGTPSRVIEGASRG